MNSLKRPVMVTAALLAVAISVSGGQNQRRNRGEIFYHCMSANTPGIGNFWLDLSAVGHIWDDSPLITDTSASAAKVKSRWVSNIRAFPEARLTAGVTDFIAVDAESRFLSYGFEPGFYTAGVRATWPNNKDLRLNGYALSVMYKYIVRESAPSLGGYTGFMPEGFGVKGNNVEVKLLYELDILPVLSGLPIRLCVNAGLRQPLEKRRELRQLLFDATAVYSGYGFDFYAGYSLESFMNLFSPIVVNQDGTKRFLVWFSENPMYFNLGGNIRYENGVTLSMTVPLLLSVNHGSRMRRDDMVELIHNQPDGIFMYEKNRGIRDPFDPWFVKWKVAGTVTVPLRFRMTAAEMMRNYLLLKNRREQKVIDIDSRVGGTGERPAAETPADSTDDARRLEKIRKKREELSH